MKTFRITEILDWTEDNSLIDGDASHEGYDSVEELLADERRSKQTFDPVEARILPFECKADNLDEAIEKLNRRFFEYDYLKVQDVDYEII
jgi:hypothetical protein